MAIKAADGGSFFSYGYNDWGGGPVTMDVNLQLGLGGDVLRDGRDRLCVGGGLVVGL